jgi:hypothetical protein
MESESPCKPLTLWAGTWEPEPNVYSISCVRCWGDWRVVRGNYAALGVWPWQGLKPKSFFEGFRHG